ncbi:polyketide beta-ketoacyl:ACP synthase [Kitasatospora sp. NBC_01287]|uniref:beta-ketoacyl synthase N-terminal-like domain-containing protein n=1 Tax=Kitasatospora sp. NBC_01287 TaxID=2903573 RepID=UPI002250DF51|nr:beta-ketoacyl synthase N-terminal-like domain-containing protein [Kitasatospora sp. NBC_01287]MCX4743985.1 polyketide beta-ketoacyl:ACP synthase [Kitasatospora sp. NBC_01287]
MPEPVITGIGVTAAIGQGRDRFLEALLAGRQAFGVMTRPGRQHASSAFLGAEIAHLELPASVPAKVLRSVSWTSQVALATVTEAWEDAKADGVDPRRVGLIVGGSNLQQRELALLQDRHRDRPEFLKPGYGQLFLDTDVAAVCAEQLGVRGPVHTVGGASAAGALAVIEAAQAVREGRLDLCVAVGALSDLSSWECQALRSLGAMGSDRYADDPAAACRPFDRDRDGFVYGESCAALVIESAPAARRTPYADLAGWAFVADAHRSPHPSLDGESAVIRAALEHAGWRPEDVDYVNPHGSGSGRGDETELAALAACGLGGVRLNATKALTGHGISAAGAVEVAATLLQMEAGRLHPTRNLAHPIDPRPRWVGPEAEPHSVRRALSLSYGFGGINTAICLRNRDEHEETT